MDLRQELPYRAEYVNYGDRQQTDGTDDKPDEQPCNVCHSGIADDSLRFAVEDHLSYRSDGQLWYHFSCFFRHFRPKVEEIGHFAQLKYDDQTRIRTAIRRSITDAMLCLSTDDDSDHNNNDDTNGPKAAKRSRKSNEDNNLIEKGLKIQSDVMYANLRFLQSMSAQDLYQLMNRNHIDVPKKLSSCWDRTADAMTFGSLKKCPKCKSGQLVFRLCGYICCGHRREVTANSDANANSKKKKKPKTKYQYFRCDYQSEIAGQPKRRPFKVPKKLVNKYSFLKKYKYVERPRIYIPAIVRAAQRQEAIDSDDSQDITISSESD